MPINLIEANDKNNFKNINFLDRYDYWIFDLDNTIYDFKLGLFRRISQRMTEYIKFFFNLNDQDALNFSIWSLSSFVNWSVFISIIS